MRDLKKELGELAVEILTNADLDDDSENGYIRVDPNALFRFIMLNKLVEKETV